MRSFFVSSVADLPSLKGCQCFRGTQPLPWPAVQAWALARLRKGHSVTVTASIDATTVRLWP